MKKLVVFFLFLFSASSVWAQTEKAPSTLEVELDPIAYLMNGYSIHGIYQPGRLRFDAGVFGIQVPEGFHGNKGFKVKTQGFGIKSHYLVKGTRGLFTGIGSGYTFTEAAYEETGEEENGSAIGIGPEIGYRIFLQKPRDGRQKGFYLSPWISMSYNFSLNKINFQSLEYQEQKWSFFPTVHFGHRF